MVCLCTCICVWAAEELGGGVGFWMSEHGLFTA